MATPVLLGEGGLNWPRDERISDRYGVVGLFPIQPISADDAIWAGVEPGTPYPCGAFQPLDTRCAGFRGQLVADVIDTRTSGHVGDLFRGFRPSTPDKGDRIVLGQGLLFFEKDENGGVVVGLRPDDGREQDWLRPEALYRAHVQTVRLWFEPFDTPTETWKERYTKAEITGIREGH